MVTNTSESTSLLDPPPILAGFIWKKNELQNSTLITAKAENFLHVRKYKLYAKQSHINSLGGCMSLYFKFNLSFRSYSVFIRHCIRTISPAVLEAFFRAIFIAMAQNKGTSKGCRAI
jgi:hypothetical protein